MKERLELNDGDEFEFDNASIRELLAVRNDQLVISRCI